MLVGIRNCLKPTSFTSPVIQGMSTPPIFTGCLKWTGVCSGWEDFLSSVCKQQNGSKDGNFKNRLNRDVFFVPPNSTTNVSYGHVNPARYTKGKEWTVGVKKEDSGFRLFSREWKKRGRIKRKSILPLITPAEAR